MEESSLLTSQRDPEKLKRRLRFDTINQHMLMRFLLSSGRVNHNKTMRKDKINKRLNNLLVWDELERSAIGLCCELIDPTLRLICWPLLMFYIALLIWYLEKQNFLMKLFLVFITLQFLCKFYWTRPEFVRARKQREREAKLLFTNFLTMMSQRLISKISSINNLQRILRWRTTNPPSTRTIHTTRSEDQIVIYWKSENFKLHNLFSALNHGDYEWQDPTSEDEV